MSHKIGDISIVARANYPVLVPDAQAIGMVAVIRSLGRADYPVHACAGDVEALGLRSRFAIRGTIYPNYDSADFLPWLDKYVTENAIRAIVPSEGFFLAIRSVFSRYAPLMPVSANETTVYECLSKAAVLTRFGAQPQAAENLPPTLLWEIGSALPTMSALSQLTTPLFVKGDGVDDLQGSNNLVSRQKNPGDALKMLNECSPRYRRLIVQGFVPGQGTGVYFLVRNGRIVQEFMNRCIHEVPHTGGFCSLRESWWHSAMMEDARKKITALGWEGVAMLEYRWDPVSDRFWFIEMNARFWASLHLALYAGIDFPTMLLDLHRGAPISPSRKYEVGLQCRYTIPSEVGYVISRCKDPSVSILGKVKSIGGWLARFCDPRIYSDLYFPNDRKLYFSQWKSFALALRRSVRTK